MKFDAGLTGSASVDCCAQASLSSCFTYGTLDRIWSIIELVDSQEKNNLAKRG